MINVKVNGGTPINTPDPETKVKLNNGTLVLHTSNNGELIKGAYIVTSYRETNTYCYKDSTGMYCTLINLDTGYLAFEERCSRTTTLARAISHLMDDFKSGKRAVERGESLELYPKGTYTLDLLLERRKIDATN